MNNSKKATVLMLLLTFAVSMLVTLPATQAQVPSSLKTYPFVEAVPNPVGDPSLSPEKEKALRQKYILKALELLQKDVEGPTVATLEKE